MIARASLASFGLALLAAPLLAGVVTRVKAFVSGRRGPPLLQPYFDLARLLGKGAVYSRTTTWVFRAAPSVALAGVLGALALLPFAGQPALVSFPGDFLVFAALLGLARFAIALAALDTGSSFEGMGASREVFFALFAEPALIFALAALARVSGSLSLAGQFAAVTPAAWGGHTAAFSLTALALFLVFLAENCRIPFDDPATHLELTMIHEVMVLDTSGPDLAFVLYAAHLKFWTLGALIAGVLAPVRTGSPAADLAAMAAAMGLLAVAVGAVESGMARLRLARAPHALAAASAFAILALVMELYRA